VRLLDEGFIQVYEIQETSSCGNSRHKAWPCPLCCERRYSRKGDLKFHFLQKHPERVRDYPDIVKSRSTKSNKPFRCPIEACLSGYMRNSDLKNHFIMKHQEHVMKGEYRELWPKQTYVCQVKGCRKMFGRKCILQEHVKFQHYGIPDDDGNPNSSEETIRSGVESYAEPEEISMTMSEEEESDTKQNHTQESETKSEDEDPPQPILKKTDLKFLLN